MYTDTDEINELAANMKCPPGLQDVPGVLFLGGPQQLLVHRLEIVVHAQHDVRSHDRHAPIHSRVDLLRKRGVIDIGGGVVRSERHPPEEPPGKTFRFRVSPLS
jgi:hypothetical protein